MLGESNMEALEEEEEEEEPFTSAAAALLGVKGGALAVEM